MSQIKQGVDTITLVEKLLGFRPMNFSPISGEFQISPLGLTMQILITSVQIALCYLHTLSDVDKHGDPDSVINYLRFLVENLIFYIGLLQSWLSRKERRNYLKETLDFEKELRPLRFYEPKYSPKRVMVCTLLFVLAVTVNGHIMKLLENWRRGNVLFDIEYHAFASYSLMITASNAVEVIMYAVVLRHNFAYFRVVLQDAAANKMLPGRDTRLYLEKYYSLYDRLRQLAQDFNQIFAAHLLGVFLLQFVITTDLVHYYCIAGSSPTVMYDIALISNTFTMNIPIFMIATILGMITAKDSGIRDLYRTVSRELEAQGRNCKGLALIQVQDTGIDQDLKFTAMNLFEINLELLFSIATSILAYIITMIQLTNQHSQDLLTPDNATMPETAYLNVSSVN